jgi:hypothetical protein
MNLFYNITIMMKSIERSTMHPIIMYNPSVGTVKTDDDKFAFVEHGSFIRWRIRMK